MSRILRPKLSHPCLRAVRWPVAQRSARTQEAQRGSRLVRYHMRMGITYSAHEAKARFAEVLRHVRGGETVTVSYRGEPMAEVRPLREDKSAVDSASLVRNRGNGMTVVEQLRAQVDRSKSEEERFADAYRRGILAPANGPRGDFKPVATIPGALARFLAERD